MNMKTFRIINFILMALVAISLVFNGCGGRATAAEGTVVAEFEWDGKHRITLEEMVQEMRAGLISAVRLAPSTNGLEPHRG